MSEFQKRILEKRLEQTVKSACEKIKIMMQLKQQCDETAMQMDCYINWNDGTVHRINHQSTIKHQQ